MATNVFNFTSSVNNEIPDQLIYRGCVYARPESRIQEAPVVQTLRYRGVSYSNIAQTDQSAQRVTDLLQLRYRGLVYFSSCVGI